MIARRKAPPMMPPATARMFGLNITRDVHQHQSGITQTRRAHDELALTTLSSSAPLPPSPSVAAPFFPFALPSPPS